ncbi:MAG: hypothetical protein ICV63_21130 [Coleofasciculus sp. Co-bin14]|nr:hypothetical protein [Coleofasciculus sp. Co-bin14]
MLRVDQLKIWQCLFDRVFGGLGSGGGDSSGIGFWSKIVVELGELPQSPCQVSGSTLGPMQIVGNQIAPG